MSANCVLVLTLRSSNASSCALLSLKFHLPDDELIIVFADGKFVQ